tara:strand:- start:2109 stop:3539 length:1431 start_codon:yes stop_codon:yes gene_type:complete
MVSVNWSIMPRKEIEKKIPPRARGVSDGLNNEPKSNSEGLTVVESEYRSAGLDHLRKNIDEAKPILNQYENSIDSKKRKIITNSFSNLPINLETDYSASSSLFKQSFEQDYNSWKSSNTDLQIFKDDNDLYREPVIKKNSYVLISLALIAVLIIIEIMANTAFLKSALAGGEKAGRVLSFSIAAINVGVSFLVGMFVVRNINHNNSSKKNLGKFLTALYIVFFIWINCSLGVFRTDMEENGLRQSLREEVPRDAFIEIGKSSMQPWNHLGDLNLTGWALIILGCAFASIGLIDGYNFSDPYPGYGKIGKEELRRRKLIEKLISDQREKIVNFFKSTVNVAKNYNETDVKDIEEWSNDVNAIQEILIAFEDMVLKWEDDISHCIEEYRQYNKQNRTTPPPEYFKEKFKFPENYYKASVTFSSIVNIFISDKERITEIKEMTKVNDVNYKSCIDEIGKLKINAESQLEKSILGYKIGV